ncbi:importin subunit alpha-1 [Coccinella septempunctata]|uniref:importin subunit alpha-1 n=1 Tax=Coccinella septempunctata TaxID=41139 RepID=UPI001D099CA9|nr:importin subunit alpha-1 [Coccinella septempunctata]
MADERIRSYKNKGKNSEEMRLRRIGQTVELRKAKKEEQLLKRRNIAIEDEDPASPSETNAAANSPVTMSTEEILFGMMNPDENIQLNATMACRKILSRERNPPIDHMIRLGVVPKCVEFLEKSHNPALQFEACWALTNIASGTPEQTAQVVQEGALSKLKLLLMSPRLDIVEQAVWAIGNIAGDGPLTRDLVLQCEILTDLLRLISHYSPNIPISLLRNIVWAISNLCRNKNPPPDFEIVRHALPTLAKLLLYKDKDVLADACWALSYLTDGTNEKIQAVLDTGMIDTLVELLGCEENTVLTPSLRTVGNIVTGNDAQTDIVLNAGLLKYMPRLLQHPKLNIVKEAAWTVSNITAGNPEQLEQVLKSGIMPYLIRILQIGDFKSQKEAAWAVTNFTSGGTTEQLVTLVGMGVIRPMCNLLNAKDAKTVLVILDGLANILTAASKVGQVNEIAIMIEECGGLDSVESLQTHENEKVLEKAYGIIENFFSEEDDTFDCKPTTTADGMLTMHACPSLPNNSGFSF